MCDKIVFSRNQPRRKLLIIPLAVKLEEELIQSNCLVEPFCVSISIFFTLIFTLPIAISNCKCVAGKY